MSTQEQELMTVLRRVIDPELGLNVVDLGLIYAVEYEAAVCRIRMTLTSPGCPMGGMLIDELRDTVRSELPQIDELQIELVWEPPWGPERMSDRARQILGLDE